MHACLVVDAEEEVGWDFEKLGVDEVVCLKDQGHAAIGMARDINRRTHSLRCTKMMLLLTTHCNSHTHDVAFAHTHRTQVEGDRVASNDTQAGPLVGLRSSDVLGSVDDTGPCRVCAARCVVCGGVSRTRAHLCWSRG